MKTIYVNIGAPGSGKTTFCKNMMESLTSVGYHSRDDIRFEITAEDQPYFKYEKQVFERYIKEIKEDIENEVEHIIMDATHISYLSREKALHPIMPLAIEKGYTIVFQVFERPFEYCQANNAKREGRLRVPDNVITSMIKNLTIPDSTELSHYGIAKVVEIL